MMLRILVPPLWSLVLLILGASLVIGPWPGALLRWFRLRISPANAKGITARPMMRASLLPKVPTRALAPKTKNATQSVVLNPMLPPKADAGPQANTALFIQLAPVKPSSLHRARFGNQVARFSDCASCGKTRKAQQPFAAFQVCGGWVDVSNVLAPASTALLCHLTPTSMPSAKSRSVICSENPRLKL